MDTTATSSEHQQATAGCPVTHPKTTNNVDTSKTTEGTVVHKHQLHPLHRSIMRIHLLWL